MAAKAKPAKTFARTIWKLIAAEMSAQDMQQAQIAKLVGVSAVTVCADAKTPEKITLARMGLYFAALGIDPDIMLRPMAHSIAERMIE